MHDLTRHVPKFLPLATLLLLVAIVAYGHPLFVSAYGLGTLASAASVILLMATGQFLVILLGGIDLSMGALAAFGTVILALWLPHLGFGAVIAMLLFLTLAGGLNGFLCTFFQIPSFITTLGTLGFWAGISLVVSSSSSISVSAGYGTVSWLNNLLGFVPIEFLFALLALALVGTALTFTAAGRLFAYAIGLAEPAALLSGIRVPLLRLIAFAISGFFAGLTALVLVAQDISGDPSAAQSLLLPSIAAVVVGGNAITGGNGGVLRVLTGALIVTAIQNGIGIVGISPFYQSIVYGAILVAAAGLTMDRSAATIVK